MRIAMPFHFSPILPTPTTRPGGNALRSSAAISTRRLSQLSTCPCIDLSPEYASAHYNLGLILLTQRA